MSQMFEKVAVMDDRLCVTSDIKYAVNIGAQNMTPQTFLASSENQNLHVYNVMVPSLQTVVDRLVLWESTVELLFNVTTTAIGQTYLDYGRQDALQSFPLHKLSTQLSCQINNNQVQFSTQDELAAILKFIDKRELNLYHGYTPTMTDVHANYSDGYNSINNELSSWANSQHDLVPRGSWKLLSVSTAASASDGTYNVPNPCVAANTLPIYVRFHVMEPLLLSPFIFAHPKHNNQGFYGISNMVFNMNMDPTGSRVWSHVQAAGAAPVNGTINTLIVNSYKNSALHFNFLTPGPELLLPNRNIVPFLDIPRFLTTNNSTLAVPVNGVLSSANPRLVTSSINLNQIPDKLVIFVTKTGKTISDPDWFAVIRGLSIQFNNVTGLLSTATQEDLYRYALEAGSRQSWAEFSGQASLYSQGGAGQFIGTSIIPTSGSIIVLDFGKHISTGASYYAPGSIGQFNIQVSLDVANQTSAPLIAPNIVMMVLNSGLWVNELGTSSCYTGILNKSDVLAAVSEGHYSQSDVSRIVGGGFFDNLKSAVGKLAPIAKMGLSMVNHPMANKAANVLGALGYGTSGSGESGSGMSGSAGRKSLKSRLA